MNKDDFTIGIETELKDLSNLKLPDPTLLDYYRRYNNREIMWNTEIDDDFVEIYQDIINWNREDKDMTISERKPIKFYINSDGGSVSAVFTIIDLIKLSKTPVVTIGLGKCLSSGGLLLMAGHKGLRYLLPSCQVLIHDGQTGAYGTVGKVLDNLEYTKELEEHVKQYILNNTSISSELYDKNYRRDWWLFADQALRYNVADKIITDINEII